MAIADWLLAVLLVAGLVSLLYLASMTGWLVWIALRYRK